MKVLYAFIFLGFINPSLFGQLKSSIELSGGIHYSYRLLIPSNDNRLSNIIVSSRNKGEAPNLHYRLGLNYNYLLKNNLILKTGLTYSTIGYHENDHVFFPIECGTGIDPQQFVKFLLTYRFSFLEIPVLIRKEFNNRKVSSFIEFGLSPCVYLNRKLTYKFEDGSTIVENHRSSSSYNRFNLSSSCSFGLNFNVNRNIQFFSQLSYRFNLTPFARFESYEFLYKGGIEMGIRKMLSNKRE